MSGGAVLHKKNRPVRGTDECHNALRKDGVFAFEK